MHELDLQANVKGCNFLWHALDDKNIDHHLNLKKFFQTSHIKWQVQHTKTAVKSPMHEHLVEGFRATVAPHKVVWMAEKVQLLFVDAHAAVQIQVAEEYESAVEIEKIQLKLWLKFSILRFRKNSLIWYVQKFQNNYIKLAKLSNGPHFYNINVL